MKIDLPSPWTTIDFIDNIRAAFNGNVQINDAYIRVEECPCSGPLNEAIDTVVEMSNVQSGLKSLILDNFPENAEFDEHLLNRLVKKTLNLEFLTVEAMHKVNDEARAALN